MATQIWIFTAFSDCPQSFFIIKFCFIHLKVLWKALHNTFKEAKRRKSKLDFYKWNPDKAQTKGAEVKPDNKSETQVAVNSGGKTNEATKDVKEPLAKEQVHRSE